jgi:hypothetical protein
MRLIHNKQNQVIIGNPLIFHMALKLKFHLFLLFQDQKYQSSI